MGHPLASSKKSSVPQRSHYRRDGHFQPASTDRKHDILIPVELAIRKAMSLRLPVAAESVDLQDASGRVLAQPLTATTPLPRFDHSAMDGYAVNVEDINGSTRLRVTGRIAASRADEEITLKAGSTVRILTGARIPPGANAVVAQEDVTRDGDIVSFSHTPRCGDNIRLRGEDVQAGSTLIKRGSMMDARAMGVVASTGMTRIDAFKRLRVAILSTGSELRQPGESIAPGEIYNSNRYILRGLLDKSWIALIDFGACHDDPESLKIRIRQAAAEADVVITTGGVSVGDEDHMADVVHQCGGTIAVAGVAIKPGKPLALGKIGQAAYIGLPGNPGAVFTTFRVVVEDLLRAWAGLQQPTEPARPAIADFTMTLRPGRTTYLPALLTGYNANGTPIVSLLPKANSGKLVLLSKAEGLVVLGVDRGDVLPGDAVGWLPL